MKSKIGNAPETIYKSPKHQKFLFWRQGPGLLCCPETVQPEHFHGRFYVPGTRSVPSSVDSIAFCGRNRYCPGLKWNLSNPQRGTSGPSQTELQPAKTTLKISSLSPKHPDPPPPLCPPSGRPLPRVSFPRITTAPR
uniref:Uncharacterized protein n=1 Tax=Rousettus aegyptiacus TaxID=9407 RepID=A0A7J8BAC7_ROUAE|nr:hypothetical protein HJG63_009971 [Rousettus aegyptiacus]